MHHVTDTRKRELWEQPIVIMTLPELIDKAIFAESPIPMSFCAEQSDLKRDTILSRPEKVLFRDDYFFILPFDKEILERLELFGYRVLIYITSIRNPGVYMYMPGFSSTSRREEYIHLMNEIDRTPMAKRYVGDSSLTIDILNDIYMKRHILFPIN